MRSYWFVFIRGTSYQHSKTHCRRVWEWKIRLNVALTVARYKELDRTYRHACIQSLCAFRVWVRVLVQKILKLLSVCDSVKPAGYKLTNASRYKSQDKVDSAKNWHKRIMQHCRAKVESLLPCMYIGEFAYTLMISVATEMPTVIHQLNHHTD